MKGAAAIRPGAVQGCIAALAALYAPPLSPDELAVYNSQRAAEMAWAEADRNLSIQLPLDAA